MVTGTPNSGPGWASVESLRSAADAREWPLDRADDVGDRDLIRRLGQPEPALGAAVAADQVLPSSAPIGALGDRVHEAVLIHGRSIRYANKQFASLVGCPAEQLLGRKLADLVPPEYSELVKENIRRRLAGESAAERYEIDMVGVQGQVSRLEVSSSVVEYDKGNALLITGVEIIPTQTTPALRLAEGAPVDAARAEV